MSGSERDYLIFSKLRKDCKQISITSYNKFIDKTEENIVNNPKHFWSFVNNKRLVRSSIGEDGVSTEYWLKHEVGQC